MLKIIIAIDSFKGSLSSLQAGKAASEGIKAVYPQAETVIFPIADGGEGTVDALCEGLGGVKKSVEVTGPLGEKVNAVYGIVKNTAIIEMASASGITLVPEAKRDPLRTTTYGVGELIRDAIDSGCRNFIIGIGGSATNDGGTGMLRALGFRFLDSDGNDIKLCGEGLKELKSIDKSGALPQLSECTFNIACDVTNPLCGENGCSAVFGPQKGATPEDIALMDGWLSSYAELSGGDKDVPGAGAAGGLGYAFMTFLGGRLQKGIDMVLRETKIEQEIASADMVITGEGRLDSQTVMGKAPVGVARIAKKYSLPVIAFSGCVTRDADICNDHGIDAFFPVLRSVVTLEEALDTTNAYANLRDTAKQVFRLIKTTKK